MKKVGIVWDTRYLAHDMGAYHPESPQRLVAIKRMLDSTPLKEAFVYIKPRMATVEEISWIHAPAYIKEIEETRGKSIVLDPDTKTSPGSCDAAFLAAGGILNAVEEVMKGSVSTAFAFIRPPGHHAERDHAMGFCIFNNVAIAAEYLLKRHNLKKIAIIDFDVHHGNGTEHSFQGRGDVFYISTHRFPFYPGTGAKSSKGNLNLPFSGGEGDDEYEQVFSEVIIPALKKFKPEFILVSAGFDAHELDPLGGMAVTEKGFARMTEMLLKVAKKYCGGKLVMVLEGGYSLEGLAKSVEACLEVLVADTR